MSWPCPLTGRLGTGRSGRISGIREVQTGSFEMAWVKPPHFEHNCTSMTLIDHDMGVMPCPRWEGGAVWVFLQWF